MPDVRQTLLQRARDIESGVLQWVPHAPEVNGECCLIACGVTTVRSGHWNSREADYKMYDYLVEREGLTRGLGVGYYNDNYIKTKEEAAHFLKTVAGWAAISPS